MISPRVSDQETTPSTRMWPVDYILQNLYSPLHLERQLPKRQWRDAFEDLLALESTGEMISLESRKLETELAVKILYGKGSYLIYSNNKILGDLARERKRILRSRQKAMLEGDTRELSWIDDERLPMLSSLADATVKSSQMATKVVENAKHLQASRLKRRGHWIASLISSGVLPEWSSRLECGPKFGAQRMSMRNLTNARNEPDEKDVITFTENELEHRFGKAESSKRKVPSGGIDSRATGPRSNVIINNEDQNVGRSSSRARPSPQSLIAQTTTSERVLLPDGSTVNKVVLTNRYGNGREERIEIMQNAGKVLEEVEKARMLMQGQRLTW
ncbi:MAG: hypothetical protein ALECFALPRED_004967 [Alectoria fallacina]|uniref:Uncharacterized protein n=1 Tax=Alectoria fallacina TaxID=1903189 RepID=A0A8H3FV34_9LECA|nr:MAG: hypothetical protein ALECFALPRED_004967 [Alectoria fallacina]